jgi:antitoxin component of MazEF toxin-antitoxin module
MKLEILETDSGLVIALPNEVLKKLGVGLGDEVELVKSEKGYEIRTDFSVTMAIAERVMEEHYDVLKRLADGPEPFQA